MGNCFSCVTPTNKISTALQPMAASSVSKNGGEKVKTPVAKKSSILFVPELAIDKLHVYNKHRRSNSQGSLKSACSTPWPRSGSSYNDCSIFGSSLNSLRSEVLVESAPAQKSASLQSLESHQSLEPAIDEILNSSFEAKSAELIPEEAVSLQPKKVAVSKAWEAEVDRIFSADTCGVDEVLDELSELDFTHKTPEMKKSRIDGPSGQRPKTRRGRGRKSQGVKRSLKEKVTKAHFNDKVRSIVSVDASSSENPSDVGGAQTRDHLVYDEAELRMIDEIEKEFGVAEQ